MTQILPTTLTLPLKFKSLQQHLNTNKPLTAPSHQSVAEWNKQLLLHTLGENVCQLLLCVNLHQLDPTVFSNVLLEEPMLGVDVLGPGCRSWQAQLRHCCLQTLCS